MAHCYREDCIHKKICYEVNSLPCRRDFVWYDGKFGCPHYNSTADAVPKTEVLKLIEDIASCCTGEDTEDMDFAIGYYTAMNKVLLRLAIIKEKYAESDP